MKKLIKILAIVFGLLIVLALVVPLVVDVDKYRPQLVQAVNERINGNLDLGRLRLSLWGQIRVEIDGLSLKDPKGGSVLGVSEAHFHVPVFSILSGSPVLTFKMNKPMLNVQKDKAGKLNLLSLLKEPKNDPSTHIQGTPGSSSISTPVQTPVSGSTPPSRIPSIVSRARLGIELRDALLQYMDAQSGLKTEIKDLNFLVRDLSLSHPIQFEVWANLDTQMGQALRMVGPARITGTAQPSVKEGKLDQVLLTSQLNLDPVEISVPGTFIKKSGEATHASLNLATTEKEARIEDLSLKFLNVEGKAQGRISNLGTTGGAGAAPVVTLSFKTNEFDFKPWADAVPALKEYELGGTGKLEAEMNGPSDRLGYRSKIAINALTAKAPQLKTQPRFDLAVQVSTDQIENMTFTMKAPGNDLSIRGKLISFSKPKIDLDIQSSGMDLDQLVHFPPLGQKNKPTSIKSQPGPNAGDPSLQPKTTVQQNADYDAMIDPIRKNKILAATQMKANLKMSFLKAYDVKLSNLACVATFQDLVKSVQGCGFQVFSGGLKAQAKIDLKPKAPTYQFEAQMQGLDIKQAVESQLALFKNTLMGKAFFQVKGTGASFNPSSALEKIQAKGSLKVDQATFATVDVAKMVGEALNKSLGQLGEKVPALKGKSVGSLPANSSRYQWISSDFSLADGKFVAPNFEAKAVPDQGVDLKGSTQVGLLDYSLRSNWEVIDTYNLTRAKDLSVEQAGTRVEHVLAEPNQPVRFPVHVGCTLFAPCYSYTEVPEFLGRVALANVGRAVSGRAKEELRKKSESLIRQAPPAVQEKLKGLFR